MGMEKFQTLIRKLNSFFLTDKIIIFILFSFAIIYYSIFNGEPRSPTVYQARDIRRAFDILNGVFVWYGPDLFGGGKAPGSFYYWLLAVPLYLTDTWHSLQPFSNLLASAAATGMYLFLKKNYSKLVGFFGFFSFLLSITIIKNLQSFWNPSYIYLFQILIIYYLNEISVEKLLKTAIGFFLLSLSVQIHMSQLVFFVAAITCILTLQAPIKDKLKLLAIALISFFIPLTPYFYWHYGHHNFSIEYDYSAALSAFFIPIKAWIFNRDYSLINNLKNFFGILKEDFLLFPTAVLLLSVFENPFKKSRFLTYSIFISMPSLFWVSHDPQFFRYAIPFFVLLSMSQAILIEKLYLRSRSLFYFWILFVIINLVISINGFIKSNSEDSVAYEYRDLEDIARIVNQHTSWSYEEFRTKSYIQGLAREIDFSLVYGDYNKINNRKKNNFFTGLLAIHNKSADFLVYTQNQLQPNWRSLVDLVPNYFLQLTNANKLNCISVLKTQSFQYCFYQLDLNYSSSLLNNIGYAYKFKQFRPPEYLKAGLNIIDSNNALIAVQELAVISDETLVYFKINVHDHKIDLTALGDPIGCDDNAATPALSLTIKDLMVEATCDKKKYTYLIGENIGYDRDKKTFLAPFKTSIVTDCKNNINTITLRGIMSGLITRGPRIKPKNFDYTWMRDPSF